MTDGIGLYGSNGSKIYNKIKWNYSNNFSFDLWSRNSWFLSGTTAQNYGTDKLISALGAGNKLASTIKTIDITK